MGGERFLSRLEICLNQKQAELLRNDKPGGGILFYKNEISQSLDHPGHRKRFDSFFEMTE